LAATAFKPRIRIIALIKAWTAKPVFQQLHGDAGKSRRIYVLPKGMSQLIVVAEPERARDFNRDYSVLDASLILTRPYAAGVQGSSESIPSGPPPAQTRPGRKKISNGLNRKRRPNRHTRIHIVLRKDGFAKSPSGIGGVVWD
jgi:hypothetical protein